MIAVETQFGTVYHRALDAEARDRVSSSVLAWHDKNPAPTPPLVEPEWGVNERLRLKELRKSNPGIHPDTLKQQIIDEAERVENPNDPAYRKLLATWQQRKERYRFALMLNESRLIRPSTDDDPDRQQRETLIWQIAQADPDACTKIFESISFHSELTDRLLWHWIEKLDLRYQGVPFAQAYMEREGDGAVSQGKPPPLLERINRMVVNRGAVEALIGMDDLPVIKQGKLAARMMWSAWCDGWDAEAARAKAKAEADAKRRQKQTGNVQRWVPGA